MKTSIVSVKCGGSGPILPPNPAGVKTILYHNEDNQVSPCQAYQDILENNDSDILIYVHDDLEITDPKWVESISDVIDMEDVVAVGLGGAISLGNKDLYRKPFNISNMARGGYGSNQVDAETHGQRIIYPRRVAVLDAFCMAVRRDFLKFVGGWPVGYLSHHCLDLWLACAAAECHKQTWTVGCECNHHGGGTSVKDLYQQAKWLQGGNVEQDHLQPHLWIYEEYRHVLPIII